MQKEIALLFLFVVFAAFLVSQHSQFASAEEVRIPDGIKNKIKLWTFDKVPDGDFVNSLIELNSHGLIKLQKITLVQNIYTLPKYGETIFVKIAGRTDDYGQTSPVSLIIVNPNGLRSEYTVPVLQSGAYSTSIPLGFTSTAGTYKIVAFHNGKELPESFFHVKRDMPIPSWIKNSAKWWTGGQISDQDFLLGIQHLIDQKVIKFDHVTSQAEPDLNVSVNGLKSVRRGTMQDIDVRVGSLGGAVEGATVSVRVEDYGENILEEFEGVTDPNGNYNISWELSKDFSDIETFLVFVDVTDGISSKTKMFSFQVYCLCGEPNCKCRN
ncbi:MAG: hypothetical protein ACT4NT_04685 [Nitrososphaerota archaeon]